MRESTSAVGPYQMAHGDRAHLGLCQAEQDSLR